MTTKHKLINADAVNLESIEDESIALVVTSPPYPMIEMWDQCFSDQSEQVKKALDSSNYERAFNWMHEVLNNVWKEADRVLIQNGFICINIGDATRNCDGTFKLFSNHSRVISYFEKLGYSVLPDILWRKQTNSPNKFMGSGMLPAGAYVTYEHEYILIFRKGGKREFKTQEEKKNRRESAYFWEERNVWFSDVWDIKGIFQALNGNHNRSRSAAYPFELAYRLINMYSVKGDTIFDPFVGTGTTNLAALASERNSIGVDIDKALCNQIVEKIAQSRNPLNDYITKRIEAHRLFIEAQKKAGKNKFYENGHHKFEVKTRQEKDLIIRQIVDVNVEENQNVIYCNYGEIPKLSQ